MQLALQCKTRNWRGSQYTEHEYALEPNPNDGHGAQHIWLRLRIGKLAIALIFYVASCGVSVTFSEDLFWAHGSASYISKENWLQLCAKDSYDGQKYLIAPDIVACITRTPGGEAKNLILSAAADFSSSELAEFLDSSEMRLLPRRTHPRFQCLRLTSGWMC